MIYFETNNGILYNGDVLNELKKLPDESVNMCVTSPPYWGLRDYDSIPVIWDDNKNCEHQWENIKGTKYIGRDDEFCGGKHYSMSANERKKPRDTNFCVKCGAWKGQLGFEPTPELFIQHLTIIFREIKRILRKDGTLWLNLGDSYCSKPSGGIGHNAQVGSTKNGVQQNTTDKTKIPELKEKDLVGIPWMTAFALRLDDWYLRQDIIWNKPNAMPEPVKDRCTKSHEYIFLLSKRKKYYYDSDVIKELAKYAGDNRGNRPDSRRGTSMNSMSGKTGDFKNKRSVWTINTKPYKEAHFAVFPEELIKPCILAGCPKGGIVIDPFFGSGTSGCVSEKLDRKWIGIELNEKYCKIAKERITMVSRPKDSVKYFF